MRGLVMVVVVAGCASDVIEARALPAEIVADAGAVADANTGFACDLYAAINGSSPPTNFFLSPFSISTVLAMLDTGAGGETDAQLRAALHATIPTNAMNAANAAVLASLRTGSSYGGYSLQIADRLFGQQGATFLAPFLATTKIDYGAELMPLDFMADPGAATDTIDGWVSDQTDGKVPMLFAAGDLDETTRLVVANAINFQGAWSVKFDPATPGPFQLADGTSLTVPLMWTLGAFGLARIPNGTLAVLPFQGELSMIVLLPDAVDGLSALEAQLTGDNLAAWLAAPRGQSDGGVNVTLPKFGIADTFDLSTILVTLGVVDAFDPVTADFSGIDGARDLSLQRVKHGAAIVVDEQGAAAEAATGGSVKSSIVVGPDQLTADHPFIFLIHDDVTGEILFLGRMADPSR